MKKRKLIQGFSERLSSCIESSGLNCVQVAERCGIERKSVYSYRNGDTIPDAFTLARLACLFGVSADYLLGIDKRVIWYEYK